MSKPGYTAICLVIDSSGSMFSIKKVTEETVNGFITEQAQAEGYRTLRLATFSSGWVMDGSPWLADSGSSVPASEVESFVLHPEGATALLDAVGTMVTKFGQELADLDEADRPEHVVFALMTDGQENSSREYTWEQVSKMLTHQQQVYSWNVTFLGANQDAIATASKLSIPRGSSLTFAANDQGVHGSMSAFSTYTKSAAAGMTYNYTDDDRIRSSGLAPKQP
jgi:hypothetical protein